MQPIPSSNFPSNYPQKNYDSRWFIWTVVFLVVAGVSLVSYILLSDSGAVDSSNLLMTSKIVTHHK